MTVQLPPPGVWPSNISRLDPSEQLAAIQKDKLEAKFEIRQLLDKYAAKHGIRPKDVNQLVWGYVDDLLSDFFYEFEEEYRREIDEARERER